jgi:cation transport regulator ChaC
MDPSTLAHLLELRDQPQLLPSKIIGYSCMLWGQYPALLDGPAGAVVYGMAYEVQTQSEKERLRFYETSHYRESYCLINLQDGRKVIGRTFLWNADRALLKEGTFDLKDWQMDKLG